MICNKKIKKKIFKFVYKIIAFTYKRGRLKRYFLRFRRSKKFFKKKLYKKIRRQKYVFKKIKYKKNKKKLYKNRYKKLYKKYAYRNVITYKKYKSKFLHSKIKKIKKTFCETQLTINNTLTNYTLTNRFDFKINWYSRNLIFLKRYFNTYNYKTKL